MLAYFVLINMVGYIVMSNDKRKAKKRKWRTRESTLWLLAIIGGAIGCWVAMQTHRHKTKHAAFVYGMPILAIIDLGLLAYLS
ncbi:DUF1294 domain-containing protein [Bacillus thermotolerans]|uniref:DUF1294 domain-containing protein n=1 Tax=Bacillus thermotolerans TaxID=1221996 RepID=A0A0F5HNB1_BACTR|nr:DUF1294 domain-containing protein [Bacillus thermotolerans]KKB34791.1 hypothetical protein QY97_02099 [Bacillus thermotolerans]KKB36682.1 hypothetical protein QY96_03410 [Bacillus thermotolerans]KKB43331.1 hypothetical protein QY95_01576 [Bacillus thermotolerans]